jgi:hypothetical protein
VRIKQFDARPPSERPRRIVSCGTVRSSQPKARSPKCRDRAAGLNLDGG